MNEAIDLYKNVVVQIATPYSTGTGFYVKAQGLIITNEHVVRGNKEVVIDGEDIEKAITKVIFTDPKFDIAFLAPSEEMSQLPPVELGDSETVKDGEPVVAVGHPMGLKYTITQGIVSNAHRLMEPANLKYVQTDAAINPGNSGGPLINDAGKVIGINTSIYQNANNIGFALQVDYLKSAITDYKAQPGDEVGTRCSSCQNVVYESNVDAGYCPHCGAKVELPSDVEDYQPSGVAKTLEDLITKAGHDITLARRGPNAWEILQGSAKIHIIYYEKMGMIIGDAYLCTLPKRDIKPIYEYMLRQNNTIEGLTFSIRQQDIVLSLVIYDRYLNHETGEILLKNLFEKSDYFDNILVEQYGANWKHEKEEKA